MFSRMLIPAFAYDLATKGTGKNILADPSLRRDLGILLGIGGGSSPLGGYHTEGDVITQTADGVDTNVLWAEFQETLRIRNAARQPLIDFLSYSVQRPIEPVPQPGQTVDFEVASEFGVPKGARSGVSYFKLGYSFDWYDIGLRYTWRYLAEASAAEVQGMNNVVLEADNRLMFTEVMKTLFRNTNRLATIQGQDVNVYAFYNNDGTVPPAYKTFTHTGTHTHYLQSAGATIASADLDTMQNHLMHHGYSASNGNQLVLMVNVQEGDTIRQFRSIANGGTAKYDFIPAAGQPSALLPDGFRTNPDTSRPPAQLRGLTVIGSYGEFTIVQEDYISAGYLVGFATGGRESLTNPIGIREHANPALRGLRLVKGRSPDYPLQESYYQRGFGTGIRQRGAGVVMRVGAAYAPPTEYS